MLSQDHVRLQLLAFTHRLIALGLHTDIDLYRALCAAYDALVVGQIAVGYRALAGRVDMPAQPTAQTLHAAIEAVIAARGAVLTRCKDGSASAPSVDRL